MMTTVNNEMVQKAMMRLMMEGEDYVFETENGEYVVAVRNGINAFCFGGELRELGETPGEIKEAIKGYVSMGNNVIDSVMDAMAEEMAESIIRDGIEEALRGEDDDNYDDEEDYYDEEDEETCGCGY